MFHQPTGNLLCISTDVFRVEVDKPEQVDTGGAHSGKVGLSEPSRPVSLEYLVMRQDDGADVSSYRAGFRPQTSLQLPLSIDTGCRAPVGRPQTILHPALSAEPSSKIDSTRGHLAYLPSVTSKIFVFTLLEIADKSRRDDRHEEDEQDDAVLHVWK